MTHLDSELKTKIVDLYSDGRYTPKELANHFKISDRTIKRWIQNKKHLSRKNVNINRIKLDQYMLNTLLKY